MSAVTDPVSGKCTNWDLAHERAVGIHIVKGMLSVLISLISLATLVTDNRVNALLCDKQIELMISTFSIPSSPPHNIPAFARWFGYSSPLTSFLVGGKWMFVFHVFPMPYKSL